MSKNHRLHNQPRCQPREKTRGSSPFGHKRISFLPPSTPLPVLFLVLRLVLIRLWFVWRGGWWVLFPFRHVGISLVSAPLASFQSPGCTEWLHTLARAGCPRKPRPHPFVMSSGAVKPVQWAHEEEETVSTNSFIPKVTVPSSPVRSPCGCDSLPFRISLPPFLRMPCVQSQL